MILKFDEPIQTKQTHTFMLVCIIHRMMRKRLFLQLGSEWIVFGSATANKPVRPHNHTGTTEKNTTRKSNQFLFPPYFIIQCIYICIPGAVCIRILLFIHGSYKSKCQQMK